MRIVIIGGETGGHIYPSLAVMDALRSRDLRARPGADGSTDKDGEMEIIYIGAGSAMEKPAVESADRSYIVVAGKARRYFSWKNFVSPFLTAAGFFQSLYILLKEMPDAVFSKGGHLAVPVAIAARMYRIPVVVHESDATPGASSQLLGKFATRVALGYGQAKDFFLPSITEVTGNIVRESVLNGDAATARGVLGLTESKPSVLILGGSQGARAINRHTADILPELLEAAQVIHQAGEKNIDETKSLVASRGGVKAGRRGYFVYPFLGDEQLRLAYAAADLVISRAGATSIAEIAANKKVALLIPLPSAANDHQRMNAYAVAEAGGAMVLEEANLTKNIFLQKIQTLLFDDELRLKMRERIAPLYAPNAANKVAEMIVEAVSNKQ